MTTEPTKLNDIETWMVHRRELLADEKAATRERDALAQRRREHPWLHIDSDYVFEGVRGPISLEDLFGEQQQLIIYHFMFGPDWEEGCPSCSFWADSFNGVQPHLAARNTSFACVSNAPIATLDDYRTRMGWNFTWVSAMGNNFNHALGASHTPDELASGSLLYNCGTTQPMGTESPGLSAFSRDNTGVYLTYQTFGRGLEAFNAAYGLLDLTATGRDEDLLPFSMAWIQRHDQYS